MSLLEQPGAHCGGSSCTHVEHAADEHAAERSLFARARSGPRHRARRPRWTPPVERAQHSASSQH